jgi:putative solute:sodium symporter small subunit
VSDEPTYTGRVRVTNPLTTAPAHVRRSVRQEIDESTGVGEVYMRSLIRAQLRAALTVVSTLVLTIGALPLVFLAFDTVTEFRLLGVPLPWWVLGVGVYPGLFVVGWLYVRQAERAERDFGELVEPHRADER